MITPPNCPYCRSRATLVDGGVVYPGKDGQFNLWLCPQYPQCNSYVGVFPGPDPVPSGSMANPALRSLRLRVRRAVQALTAIPPGQKRRPMSRRRANAKVAEILGKSPSIGWFDDADCMKVLLALGPEVEHREAQ